MKYKCCDILKHGLCFFQDLLVSCCFSPMDQVNGGRPPILIKDYNGKIFSKDFLFSKINEYVDVFKSGKIPKECVNCYHINEKEQDEDKYIDYITISHFTLCNADCIYCTNNLKKEERRNDYYKILPILRSLKEQNVLKEGIEFHIGGGEFTIYEEFDAIFDEFVLNNFAKIFIPTNAIKYSQKLSDALQNGYAKIVVSIDCGCRNTYKKIKRVDKFNNVVDNLKKYAEKSSGNGAISLKYIIIPSVNDNYREFEKFLEIVSFVGADIVIIDIDAKYARYHNYKINSYLLYFAKKLYNKSKSRGFTTQMYSFWNQCENVKKKNNLNLIKDFIEYRILGKNKILYKNILKGDSNAV